MNDLRSVATRLLAEAEERLEKAIALVESLSDHSQAERDALDRLPELLDVVFGLRKILDDPTWQDPKD